MKRLIEASRHPVLEGAFELRAAAGAARAGSGRAARRPARAARSGCPRPPLRRRRRPPRRRGPRRSRRWGRPRRTTDHCTPISSGTHRNSAPIAKTRAREGSRQPAPKRIAKAPRSPASRPEVPIQVPASRCHERAEDARGGDRRAERDAHEERGAPRPLQIEAQQQQHAQTAEQVRPAGVQQHVAEQRLRPVFAGVACPSAVSGAPKARPAASATRSSSRSCSRRWMPAGIGSALRLRCAAR